MILEKFIDRIPKKTMQDESSNKGFFKKVLAGDGQMTDTVSQEKRSEVMSKIRSKDTKIEIKVRLWLYHQGIRYRKNYKKVAGSPDIALPKYKIAIFVQGCFWHGHDGCKLHHIPKTRVDYWQNKINNNRIRDQRIQEELTKNGWHVIVVWECQVNKQFDATMNTLLDSINKIRNRGLPLENSERHESL